MGSRSSGSGSSSSGGGSEVEAGFPLLQGDDFEYYMQTYSILLGRNSKKSSVDVDLSSLGGGGMNISRNHARIFYDFQRRRFALEVLGKNGCFLEGVHHLPQTPPLTLHSQDLLQIGDKDFYFLLPRTNILAKNKNIEGRSRPNRDDDNRQLLQLEDKDVLTSVANVLSDVCGPGDWMTMEKLHSELMERFGNLWHHNCVRRYLTSEDYESPEATAKPWYGLLMLLRKFPEYFVINTRSKGRVILEFVSLVSLIP